MPVSSCPRPADSFRPASIPCRARMRNAAAEREKIYMLNRHPTAEFFTILMILLLVLSCVGEGEGPAEVPAGEAVGEARSEQAASSPGGPRLDQTAIEGDYHLPEEQFAEYRDIMQPGLIIPGLFQAAVPQGLAYIPEARLLLISNYMFDNRPAAITCVFLGDDRVNGGLEKTIWIYNGDGSPHMGHMGGIAVSDEWVWIASGPGFYRLPLSGILEAGDGSKLLLSGPYTTEVACSAATVSGGVLYISEFRSRDGSYRTPKSHYFKTSDGKINHALAAGFILADQSDGIPPSRLQTGIAYPDYFISIPDEVQGIAFLDDRIVLSQSYGRRNDSRLSVYTSPLGGDPDGFFTLKNGQEVPVWILDDVNKIREITAPPMSEGICLVEGQVAVLFESGSDKYRDTARSPQSRIHFLPADSMKRD